jgi:uncharacterized protein YegP (UPF0339 family)
MITLDGDGYRARAYGGNHELVWWTEAYTTRTGAKNAIALMKSYTGDSAAMPKAAAAHQRWPPRHP